MKLVRAEFTWIRKVGRGAKMLGGGSLGVKDTRTTEWFKAVSGRGGAIGFCGVITLGNTKRVKGIYVFPEYRGANLGTDMTEALIDRCLTDPTCHRLEAFTVKPSWYEARGWTATGKNAHGYARVQKTVKIDS